MISMEAKSNMYIGNEKRMIHKGKKYFAIIVFCILAGVWTGNISAQIILEEDFDGQVDWMPVDNNESCNNVSNT